MQETEETQDQSLGREDPLEEDMAIHSSIQSIKYLFNVYRILLDSGNLPSFST